MKISQLSIFDFNRDFQAFPEICDILECDYNEPAWPDRFGKAIREYLKLHDVKTIKTLSLFSGAGGLDIGFSDIGFEIIESVEIESKFCETLELNSGSGKRFEKSVVNNIDIREFDGERLRGIEFIIGGPPCQTFSAAGRRAAGVLGITDDRGVLFREYVRLLKQIKPKGFLFENVYGIVGADNGEAWKEILKSFSEIGYTLHYMILDAADYGVPQHRERLLIVGVRDDEVFKFPKPTHGPDSIDEMKYYNAECAVAGVDLSGDEIKEGINGRYGHLLKDIPPGLNYSFYTENMGHPNPIFAWRSKFSDFLYKADPNTPVRTIKAQGGQYTGPFHWDNRPFTFSEYKRLQTFPDDYIISGNRQVAIQQIGNSVPPQLARMIAIAIRQQLFHTEFPLKLPLLEDGEKLTFRKRKRELTKIYKQKADNAITALKEHKPVIPKSRKYEAILSETFAYKESKQGKGDYDIDVIWNNSLEISIFKGDKSKKKFIIYVTPNNKEWQLNVKQVILCSYIDDARAFTVAWRAFEKELIDNSIKADLVQLSGYYQYTPAITSRMDYFSNNEYYRILSPVVNGTIIAKVINTSELQEIWSVSEEDVLVKAEMLRSLGYEIRNHKTNPQIMAGNWLIPYAFPTLTPMSVQLRKKLR